MPRKFSVLLVEDDDPLRMVLCDLLQQWGWTVHSTGHGKHAIDLVHRVAIDFSILDMHLPGMTGVEVYRTIRNEIGALPSILMSGDATPEEAQRALELGVFQFLRKPLELRVFRQSLDTLIAHYFGQPGAGAEPNRRLPVAQPPARLPGTQLPGTQQAGPQQADTQQPGPAAAPNPTGRPRPPNPRDSRRHRPEQ